MNLQETLEWVQKIELVKVPEKKRHHAKCYVDMMVEKIGAINNATATVEKYMNDIDEYLKQLEKINLYMPSAQREPKDVVLDDKSKEKKVSPLMP